MSPCGEPCAEWEAEVGGVCVCVWSRPGGGGGGRLLGVLVKLLPSWGSCAGALPVRSAVLGASRGSGSLPGFSEVGCVSCSRVMRCPSNVLEVHSCW